MRWVLRWQRPILAAAFVLLLVAAILGAANTGSDDETARVSTGSTSTTTTTTAKPKTTTTTGSTTSSQPEETTTTTVAGSESPTSRSTSTSTSTTRPPDEDPPPDETTTTTALVCRDSVDPACGPFYWDPAPPANQPLTITVDHEPKNPLPGTKVTITVNVNDPDAQSFVVCVSGFAEAPPCSPPSQPADGRYGPWTPPSPPGAGHVTKTYTTSFVPPSQTVTVEAWSWAFSPYDLYSGHDTAETVIDFLSPDEDVTAGRGRDRVR